VCFDEKPNTKSYLPSAMILKSCQRQFLPLPNHESYLDSDHFFNPKIMVKCFEHCLSFHRQVVSVNDNLVFSSSCLGATTTNHQSSLAMFELVVRTVLFSIFIKLPGSNYNESSIIVGNVRTSSSNSPVLFSSSCPGATVSVLISY
jgi:hypothetical protein